MSDNEKLEPHITKRFQVIKKSGNGAYGVVWKVVERQSRRTYALKKNFDAFQNSTDAQRTYRQIIFLQRFRHPNIINLKQVIGSLNEKDIYLLFEYMDIDLYSLIREEMLKEQHKKFIVYQIAKAFHYLHSAGLIHRDIKPSNILVNEECNAKVCDFGLIRSLSAEAEAEQETVLTEYIATRWYRAPEILLGSKKYSTAADVWSFGCLIGELFSGKPMFPGHSTLNQIERVITWTGPPTIQDLQSLKTNFGREMLELLTKIKPHNRKQWISSCTVEAYDMISKTLNFNPQKRPSMLEILKHPYLREFYNSKQVIEAKETMRVQVGDNQKLSLGAYRDLIYQIVDEYQQKKGENIRDSTKMENYSNLQSEPTAKTLYKTRVNKTRSASKNKEDSLPKTTHKQSNTVNIKKKLENSLVGRQDLLRSKYKTEQVQEKQGIFKKKKSDQMVKYHTAEKKKKSFSVYQGKRQAEIWIRHAYNLRKG